jgi:hypothetical protein
MRFAKWLEVFVEEKGLENEIFNFEMQGQFHMVEMTFLVEFLQGLDKESQKKI